MNNSEFIEKIQDADVELFINRNSERFYFIAKDDAGQAWKVDSFRYFESEEFDPYEYAINQMQCDGRNPYKAKPIFGVIGYEQEG